MAILMKVFLLCLLFSSAILSQTEKNPRLDSTKAKKDLEQEIKEVLPSLGFEFGLNNVEEINLLFNKMLLSDEEIRSGLTGDAFNKYMNNKTFLKSLMKLPPNEAKEYPAVHKLRQILGSVKTVGVIIILLLSVL